MANVVTAESRIILKNKNMKTYRIVLPAWWEEVEAETPDEAVAIAMFDYDNERSESDLHRPELYEVLEGNPRLKKVEAK